MTVTNVEVTNNRLTINFNCKGQIRKFFQKTKFSVEYNTSIEGVPEAILIIPFLSSVCPIAWANKADVYVEVADETFLRSLHHVQKTLQRFYPKMGFSGQVYAKKVVTPPVGIQANSMMLFSGGVDSLATFIRHQAEKPILVTVQGADIDFNDVKSWSRFAEYLQKFSDTTGSPFRTVRYNCIEIIDWFPFREYDPKISWNWWATVMHGLALLGVCAPLTYMDKVGKLYIASSFNDSFQIPWGSHPELDNYVGWTGTRAVHDGYEFSRQEKIDFLADYLNNKEPDLYIRACFASRNAENCSVCEKCSRTIIGLELAGIDPNKHGFVIARDTFLNMKRNLANEEWRFGDDEEFMWLDLKKHASRNRDLPHPEAKVLIDWLLKADIKAFRSPMSKQSRFIPFFKYLPYTAYGLVKRSYNAVNRLVDELKKSE